jgi:hypothetical protein
MRSIVAGAALLLCGCGEPTMPLVLDPSVLALRVEVSAASVALTDTLELRLVAVNPRDRPVSVSLPCGHQLLTYAIRDAHAQVDGEPHLLCLADGRTRIVMAPGDSLVRLAEWHPRPITVGLHAMATPPGPYTAVAVLDTDYLQRESDPVSFALVAP